MEPLKVLYEEVLSLIRKGREVGPDSLPTLEAIFKEEKTLLQEASRLLLAVTPEEASVLVPLVETILGAHEELSRSLTDARARLLQEKERLGTAKSHLTQLRALYRLESDPRIMDQRI